MVFEDADENDFRDVVSLLISHGVEPIEAQRYVTSVVKPKPCDDASATFFEVYGQGGLTRAAKRFPNLNVQGLEVMDLRSLKADGTPWDFLRHLTAVWL